MNLNLAALTEEQRAGVRLATFARLGALVILGSLGR